MMNIFGRLAASVVVVESLVVCNADDDVARQNTILSVDQITHFSPSFRSFSLLFVEPKGFSFHCMSRIFPSNNPPLFY